MWRSVIIRIVLIIVMFLISYTQESASQYPVIDVAAVTQLINTVIALGDISGLQAKDLAKATNIGDIIAIAAQAQALFSKVQAIGAKLQARAQGWDSFSGTIPCTPSDQSGWLHQANTWAGMGVKDARFALGLIGDSIDTLNTLLRLIVSIETVFGTTSGSQTLSAITSVQVMQMEKLHGIVAPYKEVMLGREQIIQTEYLSNHCIGQRRWEHWGSFTRY